MSRKRSRIHKERVSIRGNRAARGMKWTGPDRWKIIAAVSLLLLAVIFGQWLVAWNASMDALEDRLSRWQNDHHLTDGEVERLRGIEIRFHGNDGPFGFNSRPTHDQSLAHIVEVDTILQAEGIPVGPRAGDPAE